MANRLVRNTAILAGLEATYGLDPGLDPDDALLVSNLQLNGFNAQNVDRDLVRPYLGGSEQLVGTRHVTMGFDIELVGAGALAAVPAYGPALRACGMAELATLGQRVDYTPVSTGFESITIHWFDDGVLHRATGCRGNVVFKLPAGGRPVMSFSFTGLYGGIVAQPNPGTVTTAFKVPQTVIDANTGDVILGGTHALAAVPAIALGTGAAYPSQGLEVDLGNKVDFTALLGGETVDITARATKGKVTLDLTAAQEVAFMGNVEAAALTTLGLLHGTVAHRKVLVWLPAVQLHSPQKADVNGKRLVGYDFAAVPVAGNDELRLATSF